MAVHRAANQRALVAAVRVLRERPEAQRVSREVGQAKRAEPQGKLQEPKAEAERLRIAVAAVPLRRAEPMVLLAAQADRVATARYPRR